MQEINPKWHETPNHSLRILKIDGAGSGKTKLFSKPNKASTWYS